MHFCGFSQHYFHYFHYFTFFFSFHLDCNNYEHNRFPSGKKTVQLPIWGEPCGGLKTSWNYMSEMSKCDTGKTFIFALHNSKFTAQLNATSITKNISTSCASPPETVSFLFCCTQQVSGFQAAVKSSVYNYSQLPHD